MRLTRFETRVLTALRELNTSGPSVLAAIVWPGRIRRGLLAPMSAALTKLRKRGLVQLKHDSINEWQLSISGLRALVEHDAADLRRRDLIGGFYKEERELF